MRRLEVDIKLVNRKQQQTQFVKSRRVSYSYSLTMSIRTQVLGLVDVMMRVPPIIVIDEILKIGMGVPIQLGASKTYTVDSEAIKSSQSDASNSADTFATIKAFFGVGSEDSATTSSLTSHRNQAILEHTIENASKSAQTSGMLSNNFNNIMDELANDSLLANMLSITTVKFVVCLLGKSVECAEWGVHRSRLSPHNCFELIVLYTLSGICRFLMCDLHLYVVDAAFGDGIHVSNVAGTHLSLLLVQCERTGADAAQSVHTGRSVIPEHN